MKHILLTFILACSALYCTARQQTISLNGIWKFKAPPGLSRGIYRTITTNPSEINWDSISVPGNWDVENEYSRYVGEAVYFRNFEIPDSFSKGDIFIRFGSVFAEAEIYLNGNYIGKHSGGYTPFGFCISDMVKQEGSNQLIVLVDNSSSRGAWWSWGGISGNVELLRYENIKAERFHISAIPDFNTGETRLTASARLENLNAAVRNASYSITFNDPAIPAITGNIRLADHEIRSFRQTIRISNKNLKMWHFNDPNLYTASLQISDDGKICDSIKTRFGVRKIETKGTQLLLNDEPVRAFGFNRVSDHRAYGSTEPLELIRQDIDHMKSMGCVITRIMHTPQSPALLDYCDEAGMLIIAESPVWGKFDPNAFGENPVAFTWYEEMISRDYNHPSIIAWSVANEIGIDESWDKMRMSKEQFRYVRSIIQHIKTVSDSNRLVTYASFTAFREKANPETDPAGLCDFISFNSYGNILENCEQIHAKWPDKPLFITEFGKGMIGENPNTSDIAASVPELIGKARKLPYLMGASLWTYNDYRSRYRGTPPSENRSWGVVDVWRNPKVATRTIRELFIPFTNVSVDYKNKKLELSFSLRPEEEMPFYDISAYKISIRPEKGAELVYPLFTGDHTTRHPVTRTIDLRKEKLSGNFMDISITTPNHFPVEVKRVAMKQITTPRLIHAAADSAHMQVVYSVSPSASGYILHYNDRQIALISPDFEIPLDKNAEVHNISLEARDDNGRIACSKPFSIQPGSDLLPPAIQHVEKVYNGYVVGFTVEKEDEWVEISYMTQDKRSNTVKSELKGSFKVRETEVITSMRIRRSRLGAISAWSREYRIEDPNP